MTWKSVEIIQGDGAEKFHTFLKENGYKYEAYSCFNYVHFEVYCNKEEMLSFLDFLYDLATKQKGK